MNINVKIEGLENITKKMEAVLRKYTEKQVNVGILGGHYDDGTPLAVVGGLHEFGSHTGRTFQYKGRTIKISGLPARSWLRVPLKRSYKAVAGDKQVLAGMIAADMKHGYTGVAFNYIGENSKKAIKEEFRTSGHGTWQRNRNKEYIEAKGHDTPLIDSGMLRDSVDFEVVEGK